MRFGRPRLSRPGSYEATRQDYLAGRLTKRDAAALLEVSESTFGRWIRADRLGKASLSEPREVRVEVRLKPAGRNLHFFDVCACIRLTEAADPMKRRNAVLHHLQSLQGASPYCVRFRWG